MQSVELSASNLAWSHSLDGVEILKVMVEDLDQQQNYCPHKENLSKMDASKHNNWSTAETKMLHNMDYYGR